MPITDVGIVRCETVNTKQVLLLDLFATVIGGFVVYLRVHTYIHCNIQISVYPSKPVFCCGKLGGSQQPRQQTSKQIVQRSYLKGTFGKLGNDNCPHTRNSTNRNMIKTHCNVVFVAFYFSLLCYLKVHNIVTQILFLI